MMKRCLLPLTLLLLASCTTPEEREAARLLEIEHDIATCKSYGLKEDTEAFGNCRLQLDLVRQERYYRSTHIRGGFGHYGSRIGVGIGHGF